MTIFNENEEEVKSPERGYMLERRMMLI